MRVKAHKEEDYAALVVVWLRDLRWEVYQEVEAGEGIADIVAVQGPLVWVIEVKKQFGIEVVGQAARWSGCANLLSVATGVSGRRYSAGRCFLEDAMRHRGIGWIRVAVDGLESPVHELVHPRLHRRTSKLLRQKLREEQKIFAKAGNALGHRFTPFKQTCGRVLKYVTLHPGCSMGELLGGVDTHYNRVSTARSCLSRWIRSGVVPGVSFGEDGKLYAGAVERRED